MWPRIARNSGARASVIQARNSIPNSHSPNRHRPFRFRRRWARPRPL